MTSGRIQGRLEGRVPIVTVGARGIGEAHVRALAGEGAHAGGGVIVNTSSMTEGAPEGSSPGS
jgi:hypothetical protein